MKLYVALIHDIFITVDPGPYAGLDATGNAMNLDNSALPNLSDDQGNVL